MRIIPFSLNLIYIKILYLKSKQIIAIKKNKTMKHTYSQIVTQAII